MDRRGFLGTMTAATLLSRRLAWAEDGRKIERIGLQLYTVRDALKRDFDGTLAKVAAVGYREVEFAGYFDHSSGVVRATLERHGLASPSAHFDYKYLGDKWPKMIADAQIIGHEYLVCSEVDEKIRNQPDGWKRIAEGFNRAGEATRKAGIQFAYHNHIFEFLPVKGKLPYEILLEQTDPNLVKMQMDLCWAVVGAQDPVSWFRRYPGRFPLVHVKDMKKIPPPTSSDKDAERYMTEVGSGIIDWKRIFAHSDEAGIKHYFVEHDEPKAPFESIKTSYQYLAQLRF